VTILASLIEEILVEEIKTPKRIIMSSSATPSFSPLAKPAPPGLDDREPLVQLPEPPSAWSASPPRLLIIGAGSRGRAYARATRTSSNGIVCAVAEPDDYKRTEFARTLLGNPGAATAEALPAEGSVFRDWREFIAYEEARRARVLAGDKDVPPGVDAAFVCVLDEMHREVVLALTGLGGLHIMCEKPLATRLQDCVDLYGALRDNKSEKGEQMVFSIGHVLRYSPHNVLLRKLLLEDRVIGDILSVGTGGGRTRQRRAC